MNISLFNKLIYLTIFCALANTFVSNAQVVKVIDNKGTITKVRNNQVTTSASSPTTPLEGDVWYDTNTTPTSIKIWDGSVWLDMEHKGTEGSVFFAGSDNLPIQNNSHFFWNNTLNRLSIGTPLAGTNSLTINGATRAKNVNVDDGTVAIPTYTFANDLDTGIFRPATNQIAIGTNGTESLRIDASQNVGIGTDTPDDAKLEVKNSSGVPFKIEPNITTPTGNSTGQMFVATDGILYIYDGTRSKWLSVSRFMVGWGRNSNNTSYEYLRQFNGALSSNNGWRMMRNGTITGISAQSRVNQTWIFQIRKNGGGLITSLTMTNQRGNHNKSINIDVSAGDYIKAYCNGNSIDYPQGLIEIAWRK